MHTDSLLARLATKSPNQSLTQSFTESLTQSSPVKSNPRSTEIRSRSPSITSANANAGPWISVRRVSADKQMTPPLDELISDTAVVDNEVSGKVDNISSSSLSNQDKDDSIHESNQNTILFGYSSSRNDGENALIEPEMNIEENIVKPTIDTTNMSSSYDGEKTSARDVEEKSNACTLSPLPIKKTTAAILIAASSDPSNLSPINVTKNTILEMSSYLRAERDNSASVRAIFKNVEQN